MEEKGGRRRVGKGVAWGEPLPPCWGKRRPKPGRPKNPENQERIVRELSQRGRRGEVRKGCTGDQRKMKPEFQNRTTSALQNKKTKKRVGEDWGQKRYPGRPLGAQDTTNATAERGE